MNGNLLFRLVILVLFAGSGCDSKQVTATQPKPSSTVSAFSEEELIKAGSEIDAGKSRELAMKSATAFLEGDANTIYGLMEAAYRSQTSNENFEKVFSGVRNMYGKPVSIEYKATEYGKKYTGTWKPMQKFFFALETEKHPKGTHFLILEIVKTKDDLELSWFSAIYFPLGKIPPHLQ